MAKVPKIVICHKCGKEVEKSAKICPHCMTKRALFRRNPVLFSVIITGAVLMMASMGKSNSPTSGSSSSATSTAATMPKPVYQIGVPISTDKLEIVVTKVQRRTKVGNDFLGSTPAEGGIYVAIQYQYKNISDKPVSRQPKFSLRDSKETQYDSEASPTMYYKIDNKLDEKFLADLNPGITVKGAEVFEVSKELFDKGGWSVYIERIGENISVPIPNQPAK